MSLQVAANKLEARTHLADTLLRVLLRVNHEDSGPAGARGRPSNCGNNKPVGMRRQHVGWRSEAMLHTKTRIQLCAAQATLERSPQSLSATALRLLREAAERWPPRESPDIWKATDCMLSCLLRQRLEKRSRARLSFCDSSVRSKGAHGHLSAPEERARPAGPDLRTAATLSCTFHSHRAAAHSDLDAH